MVPSFASHADRALDLFFRRVTGPSGSAVDIQDLASKFTLDAATDFLFGQCVHSLQEDLPRPWNASANSAPSSPSSFGGPSRQGSMSFDPLLPSSPTTELPVHLPQPASRPRIPTERFPSAFTSALSTLASRLRSGALWPLFEITRDSTKKDVSVIRGFVKGIVERALEKREEREKAGVEEKEAKRGTLLDHLVTVSDGTCPFFVPESSRA